MFKTNFPILLAIFISNVAFADVVRHRSLPDSFGAFGQQRIQTTLPLTFRQDLRRQRRELRREFGQRNAGSGRTDIFRPFAMLSPFRSGRKEFQVNLVIWPKKSDEIAVGPGFTSLKIFHRCRDTRPPPTGVARSREAPLSAADTGRRANAE